MQVIQQTFDLLLYGSVAYPYTVTAMIRPFSQKRSYPTDKLVKRILYATLLPEQTLQELSLMK